MKKQTITLLAVMLLLCFALSACGSPAAPAATAAPEATAAPAEATPATPIEQPTESTKDSITVALQGEPTSLDAQYPDDGNMRPVTDNVLECLFALDGQTLEVIPRLATEMNMIDDVTWEVKLREGVKFHDGDTFDAEDAAFSINRIIDPNFGSQILSDFDTIKEAKVVDANTIQIITKAADPLLNKRLTKLVMVSKSFTEAHTNEELTLLCNGTGPYKLVSWERGVSINLTSNEEYWGDKPVIKTAVYRFLEEPATRLSALKAGEIDIAVNMYPEYAADMPKAFSEVSYETYWVRFNELSGVMANPKIRLAANLAIDRQSLADALFLVTQPPRRARWARTASSAGTPMYPRTSMMLKRLRLCWPKPVTTARRSSSYPSAAAG
jgi:peptide/nickel transport system substrate-binding protein